MADLWRFFCRFLLFTDPTVVLRLMSAWLPSPISDLSTRIKRFSPSRGDLWSKIFKKRQIWSFYQILNFWKLQVSRWLAGEWMGFRSVIYWFLGGENLRNSKKDFLSEKCQDIEIIVKNMGRKFRLKISKMFFQVWNFLLEFVLINHIWNNFESHEYM